MHSVTAVVLVVFCFVCIAAGTQVSQCEGKNFPDLSDKVTVGTCKKAPCKLRKKQSIVVNIKFKSDKKIETIKTNVYAEVLGLPLPFVGVDGISACDKIFEVDGGAPAPCPLKKNTEYLYNNSFPVLEIYPRLSLVVHWSLSDQNNRDVSCFEVAARIL